MRRGAWAMNALSSYRFTAVGYSRDYLYLRYISLGRGGAAARLGVAAHLPPGPRSSDDLAHAVGAQPQALHRVLRMLASIGVFGQPDPGVFALTPLGETLRSDTPGSLRFFAIAETAFGHWAPWGRLLDSVKTGAPMAREALGGELWEWYGRNAEEAEFFSAAM